MRADAEGVRKRAEASPKLDDFVKDAKASDVKYAADGSWTATVRGEQNIRRALQMQKEARAQDVENGRRMRSRQETERLVNKRGGVIDLPAHLAEHMAKKQGLKPKVNWGRPSERWVVRGVELVRVF